MSAFIIPLLYLTANLVVRFWPILVNQVELIAYPYLFSPNKKAGLHAPENGTHKPALE